MISDSFLMFPGVHNHIMQPTFFLTLLSILSELTLFFFVIQSMGLQKIFFLKKRGRGEAS